MLVAVRTSKRRIPSGQKKDPAISGGVSLKLLAQCLTLSRLNVRRGRTLRALLQTEFHFLAFGQGLETTALDGGVMHEDILAAVGGGDKAKTLGVVKPLYCSCNHGNTSVS